MSKVIDFFTAERLRGFLLSPAFVVFLLTFVVNLFVSWFWFSTYRIWNFDLAWQAQVVESYAHLKTPVVPMVADDYPALGNHFSPILALAAPIYLLFPQTFTLNVVMAFCFALSAGILAGVAREFLGRKSAYILGIGLGLSWGFLTASSAGFHEYVLGAPILAYALARFLKGRYLSSAIAASFLVFVKEDVGLLLLGFGLVLALRAKQWRWLLLSVWGAFWLVFTIKFLIPTISGEWDFAGFISINAETLFTDAKFKIVLVVFLLLQGAIIALRSPLVYVVVPFLAARLFSAWGAFYVIGYHYDVLTTIVVMFALLDALARYEWKPWLKKLALATPLLLTVVYLLLPTPGNNSSYLTRDYSRDQEAISAYEGAFQAVPPGATVAADDVTVAGFIDRGYETYYIRTLEDHPAPDCLVYPSEDIFGADKSKVSSIEEISKDYGVTYELRYDSEYEKVWCRS